MGSKIKTEMEMEMNSEEPKKIKQFRQKTNKKWTDSELKKIVNYLKNQPEFEKPTAQIFYRKFLEQTHIDATWNIVKWKVKHLKVNYNKAEMWRKSNDASLIETDEGISSVKDKLYKICRFYDELHSIFGRTSKADFPVLVVDNATSSNMSFNNTILPDDSLETVTNFDLHDSVKEPYIIPVDQYVKSEIGEMENLCDDIPSARAILSTTSLSRNHASTSAKQTLEKEPKIVAVKGFGTRHKKSAPKNTLDQLSVTQSEKKSYLKEKLEFEKEKFKMEFSLKERRFLEEIEERKEKYELKKLKLEKQERIEKFEIEMKYKYCCNKEM